MKNEIIKANSRGHASHGWLDSWHSFSFGHYQNNSRIHFGALRVLNDDTVAPSMGFGKHPHDNMEIISIPLEGALEHEDNTGTKAVIRKGEVQVMSAGSGIVHSEKNKSHREAAKFLQIWIIPDKRNVSPRYDQKVFEDLTTENVLHTIVSPIGSNDAGVQIHQDAWLSFAKLKQGHTLTYDLKKAAGGLYVFVIDGTIKFQDAKLESRDALTVTDFDSTDITADTNAEVLLIEVPMIA